MDKAKFNEKYKDLLNEFNEKYKSRNKKQLNELNNKIQNAISDDIKKDDSEVLIFDITMSIMKGFERINIDYINHLVYFMLDSFMTDTDKEK